MRRLRAAFGFAACAAALYWGRGAWQRLAEHPAQGPAASWLGSAKAAIATVLDADRWTVFPLAGTPSGVRLVTNAGIPAAASAAPGTVYGYAIRYQVLGGGGEVLRDRTYHQRTRITRFKDPEGVRGEYTAAFYVGEPLVPADGRALSIDLEGLARPSQVRVELARRDSLVHDVVVRASHRERVPAHRLGNLWKRLSEEQKAALARGNVYPHDLLSESEVENLLRERWRPLGPSGVEGRDYVQRKLYLASDLEGEAIEEPVPPAGLMLGPGRHAVVPIPEAGGRVRLVFQSDTPDWAAAHAESPEIQFRWYGPGPRRHREGTIRWQGNGTRFEDAFDGGLLELSATSVMTVRAYLAGAGGMDEITPRPILLRSYLCERGAPVEFEVAHAAGRPTPLRLTLWRVIPPLGAPESGAARYQLLGPAGDVLQSGEIPIAGVPSVYDSAPSRQDRVSDPASYYFSLPPAVARVRVMSDQPVLVAAANRPADLVRERRVPEDSYLFDPRFPSGVSHQPPWFPLQPANAADLVLGGRSVVLWLQPRPEDIDPEVQAGRYVFEDYRPLGAWLGRQVFAPVDTAGPIRERVLPVSYRPLPARREVVMELHAPRGTDTVLPRLAYFRDSDDAAPVTVHLDDRRYFHGTVVGRSGEVSLPAAGAGRHRMRLAPSDPTRFFMSHAAPAPGGLLKRLAYRLGREPLDFRIPHGCRCKQILSGRWYVPVETTVRSRISVGIEPQRGNRIGPDHDYSFHERRYDLRPDPSAHAPVQHTGGETMGRGQNFAIPLGEDLPPGIYRLRFALEGGPTGYLTLAKLTPGVAEERRVLLESGSRDRPLTD
jgi:hypothetical protein